MKPGTFTQLYTQIIFAVKYRECLFHKNQRTDIYSYVSGIISNLKHKPIIVNGFSDHIHVFFGQHPSVSVSDTVNEVKKSSAWFINENRWFPGKFQWQDGYGAFSYSRSQIDQVYKYIANQEQHHQKSSFKTEYIEMLRRAEIEYDENFLFEFFE